MKIALVWASENPDKFWNKILKNLIDKWYTVIPVNPKSDNILGLKAFQTIWDIKENYDVVNFVVPPSVTLGILQEYRDVLGNKKIWCQPGSSDDNIKQFLSENNFTDFILDSCIMLKKID